jgi:hypothetical protein
MNKRCLAVPRRRRHPPWQAFLEAPEQQDTHEVMGTPQAATADAQQQQQEEDDKVGGGGSQPQLTLQNASFRWAAAAAAAELGMTP